MLREIGVVTLLSSVSVLFVFFLRTGPFLTLIPASVFGDLQFWRLFTFPLASGRLFRLAIDLLFLTLWGMAVERTRGSVNFLLRIVLTTWTLAFVECIFYSGLSLFKSDYASHIISYGFFKLYFVELTALCFESPHSTTKFCALPLRVKNYLIPFIALFFEALYSRNLHDVTCIAAGVLEASMLGMFRWAETYRRFPWLSAAFEVIPLGTFYQPQRKIKPAAAVRIVADLSEQQSGMETSKDILRDGPENSV